MPGQNWQFELESSISKGEDDSNRLYLEMLPGLV